MSEKKKKVIGRPFPPGVSGNPSGRPKGSVSISTLIRQNNKMIVEVELPDKTKKKMTLGQAIALNQQLKAAGLGGKAAERADTSAAHFITDRDEGKVKDVVKLENDPFPDLGIEEVMALLKNAGSQTRANPPGKKKRRGGAK